MKDFSVEKIGNTNEYFALKMSRTDVERILGHPLLENNNEFRIDSTYNSGIEILYRNEYIVVISLLPDSEMVYQTHRGLYIGLPNKEVKARFNQKSEETLSSSNINYLYDSEIDDVIKKAPNPPKDKVFVYNIEMNVITGKIQKIRLWDNQAFTSTGQMQ
ncbi:hypothetical protein HQN87_20610 [Paenibacillus tritici]|uniref:Uncharacterized protein n=1 Tax=Paenibacillus tritici TaxID=1873425 RepID=A0ABX2DVA6_9BACL|nr:hypothetical protein [Paenibacillus tritici]NQX47731.1 hypothetical protein [Paenibacillus tritici]